MDTRQRFINICHFKSVDRPPRWEATMGFMPQTIERWRKEGLSPHVKTHRDVEEYFGMEPRVFLPVNSGFTRPPFDPPFKREVLWESGEVVVFREESGIICKAYKKPHETATPGVMWVEHPVKTREGWEKIKWRLDPDNRKWPDWKNLREKYDNFPYPLALTICGAFGFPRCLLGDKRLLLMYYRDPRFVHEILEHWLELYKKICSTVIRNVRVDYILIWEDMAWKKGPLVSPRIFKEFISPYYEELISHVKKLGVDIIMVDSDGNLESVLGLFIEAGVNAMMPFEIAAGMDPLKIRREYGDALAIMGGIDKRVLAELKKAIEREVLSKVPKLVEEGGYIPFVDHNVPPNVSLDNMKYYISLVRSITERNLQSD
ncbi:MAG: hypothetical protein DRN04_02080 [Thermoprotei archaeon]|nr:MAG: hypothetical protein DRN04_02080 [Thermoprotei archaeon]